MREIKFRGKRKGGIEILIGDLVRTCNGGPCIFPCNDDSLGLNSPDYYEIDPETMGQFTGAKDENGKEKFEGDITFYKNQNRYFKIEFFKSGFWEICLNDPTFSKSYVAYDRGEIIGNVFSNPELFEKKEKQVTTKSNKE